MTKFKICFFIFSIATLFFAACKKTTGVITVTPTVQNLAGTYNLTGEEATISGFNYNYYNTLPDCEKDNLYKLNADLTLNIIDTGIVCSPPENSTSSWYLSNDSLYYEGQSGKIVSFDGKTIILNGNVNSTTQATITFQKVN